MLLSYKCTYLWYSFFSGVIYCSIRLLALWRKVRFHVKLYVVVRALEWFRFLFLTCICFFLFVCTSPSFALSFMMLVDYFSCWDASRLNQKGEERSFTRLVLPFIVNLWDHICDSISLAAFVSLNEACICVCMYLLGFQFGIFPGKTNLAIDLLIINFFHGLWFGKDILSLVWSGICQILLEVNHVTVWWLWCLYSVESALWFI